MRVKLEEVCKRIYAGGDVPKDRYSEMKTDKYSVPIYANAEKNDGLYGYTDKAREKELSITVAARGTIGFTVIRREPFLPVIRLITVVPDTKKVSERYLYYVLKNCKPQFSGTSIPQLTVPDIKKNSLELYNTSEQIKIADRLDKISKIIELRKQELSALDNLIKARFVEMFGDVIHNNRKWKCKQFSDITSSRLGKMLDTKHQTGTCKYPYLANFNVQWFRFELANLNEMDFNEKDRKEFCLEDGDLLVCEGGEIGRCAVWHNQVKKCFFQKALHRVRCNQDIILPDYLSWWFKYNCENGGFAAIEGAKATISHLTGAKMKMLDVTVPPIELQEQFVDFIHQVDKSKVKVQKALDETQKLFDSLMQQYFG
mgnify:CR=1 FL=1